MGTAASQNEVVMGRRDTLEPTLMGTTFSYWMSSGKGR